jgi:hypothetical protein
MKFNFKLLTAFLLLASLFAQAETPAERNASKTPEPVIQDNSFLIEEAYNQEFGVVQHINTFMRLFNSKDWVYTFTQEWPLPPNPKSQFSYTLALTRPGAFSENGLGVGDVLLNYRYQLAGNGETRFAFSPRLTLILPAGSPRAGRGLGGAGLQTNLPLSVVLKRHLVTHWNAGATVVPHARNSFNDRATTIGYNLGQSVVWLTRPNFNVLVETSFASVQSVTAPNRTAWSNSLLVSPGIRWAHNFASGLQIVPGLAVPIGVGPSGGEKGIFLYLSFEHSFRLRRQ